MISNSGDVAIAGPTVSRTSFSLPTFTAELVSTAWRERGASLAELIEESLTLVSPGITRDTAVAWQQQRRRRPSGHRIRTPRLDARIRGRLDELAATAGLSRSAVAALLLETLLGDDGVVPNPQE